MTWHWTRARGEYVVLLGLLGLFIVPLSFSMLAERTRIRDDLRVQDLANLKRALEQYNNVHTTYVAPPLGKEACTTSADPNSWFFATTGVLQAEGFIDALPLGLRPERGFHYSYCATDYEGKGALGFYLQANLEQELPDTRDFDEDERRKFKYRVLSEQGRTLYRVCGGTELQCELTSS